MNVRLATGYLLTALCVLVLTAFAALLLVNTGGAVSMHLYIEQVPMAPALWLIVGAVGGILTYWSLRSLLPTAIGLLRKGAEQRAAQQTRQAAQELRQEKKEQEKRSERL